MFVLLIVAVAYFWGWLGLGVVYAGGVLIMMVSAWIDDIVDEPWTTGTVFLLLAASVLWPLAYVVAKIEDVFIAIAAAHNKYAANKKSRRTP